MYIFMVLNALRSICANIFLSLQNFIHTGKCFSVSFRTKCIMTVSATLEAEWNSLWSMLQGLGGGRNALAWRWAGLHFPAWIYLSVVSWFYRRRVNILEGVLVTPTNHTVFIFLWSLFSWVKTIFFIAYKQCENDHWWHIKIELATWNERHGNI